MPSISLPPAAHMMHIALSSLSAGRPEVSRHHHRRVRRPTLQIYTKFTSWCDSNSRRFFYTPSTHREPFLLAYHMQPFHTALSSIHPCIPSPVLPCKVAVPSCICMIVSLDPLWGRSAPLPLLVPFSPRTFLLR